MMVSESSGKGSAASSYVNSCSSLVSEYTGKKNVFFCTSGNNALWRVLRKEKREGAKRIIVQDQGGWLSYIHYAKRLGLELVRVETSYGIVGKEALLRTLHHRDVVVLNSAPGYFCFQDSKPIHSLCRNRKATLITDASGSLGHIRPLHGHYVFGSFGKHKPAGIGSGGFIASDLDLRGLGSSETGLPFGLLHTRLSLLPDLYESFFELSARVKNELLEKGIRVLCPERRGINVIALFDSDEEKKAIEEYCEKHKYEYTHCPRYIRVERKAVSIELKRLDATLLSGLEAR